MVNPTIPEIVESSWYRKVLRITDEVVTSAERFLKEEGLCRATCPVSTNSISSPMGPGSDSLPVEVTISGKKVYLADSMQFFLEVATRLHPKGVYYTMTSFRGEQADERHLNEFTHLEAELNLGRIELMHIIERMLERVFHSVVQSDNLEYEECKAIEVYSKCIENGIERISYADAKTFLSKNKIADDFYQADLGLSSNEELALLKEFGPLLWVDSFPSNIVPFYQHEINGIAECADLLGGIGEFIGMGQRCFDENETKTRMLQSGVNMDGYHDYLALKSSSPMLTSGFGLGVERLVALILQQTDIRKCTILPRDYSKKMRL